MSILPKFKPISISLSPNVQKDDVVLAWKLLWQPWRWKKGSAILKFETEFAKKLEAKHAISFNSGRSALYAILKALELPNQSDVLLQAFTCNAVSNPILWAGLNPVYLDCANNYNLDLTQIPKNTVPLIVQHTFGAPANVEEIKKQYQGIIIEDCAHALGAKIGSKYAGTLGDAGFFSFSRDKVISCVYGGMAVTNNDNLAQKLRALQQEFGQPKLFWVKQQLQHPVLLQYVILPLYNFFDLGKLFLIASQWFHILSKAVSWQEKRGLRPDYFPHALPNALAILALNQFKKLDTFNAYRQKMADFYFSQLAGTSFGLPQRDGIFLRFTVTHPKAHEIIYEAWHQENILLGDWYTSVIAPFDTKLEEIKYKKGSCPNAEHLAKITLNLPTHININQEEAQRIVNFLKKWK